MSSESPQSILKRVMGIYSIPSNFPVDLVEGEAGFYPGEYARIDYKHDDQRVIHGVKVLASGRFSDDVLFHELAHLKLRFMGVPVYMVFPDMPAWIVFFLVVHDEYYAQLVTNKFAPEISRGHFRNIVRAFPSPEELHKQLQRLPNVSDPRLYEGLVSVLGGEISRFVSNKSKNLWDYREAFNSRARIIRKSALRPYVERFYSELQSLPPLPSNRFSAEDELKITRFINREMKIVFGKGLPEFKPSSYSFQYP